MNKIACFDLDGVAIHEHEPFSKRLILKQGEIIRPAVDDFFSNNFGKVMIGEEGLKESIEPYLERFQWEGGVDSLLDFWFEGERSPNDEVLKLIEAVRGSGIDTFLVTDNPAERVARYWSEFLGQYFVGKYVSGETGLKKSKVALWGRIAQETGTAKEGIFFTDDDVENVETAKLAGVHAVLFAGMDDLKRDLEEFLI